MIGLWIAKIDTEAKELVEHADDGDRDNLLKNEKFAKHFIGLCKMLPIWSAISCKFFDTPYLVGSSWLSETNFKNVKQLHDGEIPCSVDQFLKRDLQLSNSSVIKASQDMLSTLDVEAPKRVIAKKNL